MVHLKKMQIWFYGACFLTVSFLFVVTIWWYSYSAKMITDQIIHDDIAHLQTIFEDIHKTTHIRRFDYEKNIIDFLNVQLFTGSKLSSMNMVYPEGWKGPYLRTTLTIQELPYIVLKHRQGYFIVPSDGVILSDGQIIGKDIIFDQATDMQALKKGALIHGKSVAEYIGVISVVPAWTQQLLTKNLFDIGE